MNGKWKSIAKVSKGHCSDAIRWLVVTFDDSSEGWFLFGHASLEEASEFDSWHQTREEAFAEAAVRWGVARADWRSEIS
jgi:hypothetical protein